MIGLRYFSLHGTVGYAEAARRYLTALAKLGVPVTWTPVLERYGIRGGFDVFEGRSIGDPELDPLCNRPIPYDVVLLHVLPWFYPAMLPMVSGKRIAACTVWESDRLSPKWRRFLKGIEALVVPCEWNRPIFRDGGFEGPIEVVPYSLLPSQAPLDEPPEGRGEFQFYSVNIWSPRKAVELTLEAYQQAFSAADPVRLILKTSARGRSTGFPWYPVSTGWLASRVLKKHRDPAPVTLLTETLSNDEMRGLHMKGDCYVSLTRSEGWGMGAFDAAAGGRPVIITGYGGQTDFLPPDLANLVNYRLAKIPFLPMSQFETGQQWAEPDVRHGAQLMRHVFENRAESRAKARELASRVCSTYEHERVGRALWDALARHF